MKDALIPLGIVLALSVLVSLVLYLVGTPAGVITPIVAGVFGTCPTLAATFKEWNKTRQERANEWIKGDFHLNPIVVSLFTVFYLQFVERTVGLIIGAVIGAALALSGERDPATIQSMVFAISPPLALLAAIILIAPIAKYAAHHIKNSPFIWIILSLVLNQMINLVISETALGLETNPVEQIATLILLLPGAIIGYYWARRTQVAYVMQNLFKQLSKPDQIALIDLAQTLPGQAAPQTAG